MSKNKKVFFTALILLTLDQLLKIVIKTNFTLNTRVTVISNFFFITYVENEGAAWSMFEGKTFLLLLISLLFLVFLSSCLKKDKRVNKINILSYGLIIGGILGNMIDRVLYKKVIDFLSIKIFGYYFPIFNIADIAIVVGTILFIIDVFREGREHGKMEEEYQKIREKSYGKVSSRKR